MSAAISSIGVAPCTPPLPVAAGRGTMAVTRASDDNDSTVEAHPPVQLAVVEIVHAPTHEVFETEQSPMQDVTGRFQLLIARGPIFVNDQFAGAFPPAAAGAPNFASMVAVTLVK